MKNYKQINEWERRQIYTLLREWKAQKYIAGKLNRDKGTISREIDRNSDIDWLYKPALAQREYEQRRIELNESRRKLKNDPKMLKELKKLLEKHQSPDAIAGRKKKEGKEFVSTMTIYNHIKAREPELKKYLKYKKWYKKNYKSHFWKPPTWRKSIEERPRIVNNRERIWDWEDDTIHSKWWTGWLVTIVERVSKFLEMRKLKRRTKKLVSEAIIDCLKKYTKEKLHTMTSDNGTEFRGFKSIEDKLQIECYHAHPYCSNERWTNEETNGMVRVFFPKWTDFTNITDEEVQEVANIINSKRRKSLGYKSASEVFKP